MKINIHLKLFIIIFILLFSKLSHAYESSVAEKYNEIFTKNILSENDVEVSSTDNLILETGNVKFQDESYLITSNYLSA